MFLKRKVCEKGIISRGDKTYIADAPVDLISTDLDIANPVYINGGGSTFLGRNPDLIFTQEARLLLCISTLISYTRIHVLPAEYPLNGLPVQVQYLDKIVDPLQPGINRSAAYVYEIKYLDVLYSLSPRVDTGEKLLNVLFRDINRDAAGNVPFPSASISGTVFSKTIVAHNWGAVVKYSPRFLIQTSSATGLPILQFSTGPNYPVRFLPEKGKNSLPKPAKSLSRTLTN